MGGRGAAAGVRSPFAVGLLITGVAALGLMPWVHAAEADATKSRNEEFIVSGKPRDPDQVRRALLAAEDRFYARYNELNTDDEFDVSCRVEAPLGQRLKERHCEPRFVQEAARDNTAVVLNASRGSAGNNFARATRADPKMDEFRRRMQQFVGEDPSLQSALVERVRLEQEYRALLTK
jgi:hypothetical protein